MFKVFIDGSAGTTGLRIREMLGKRTDISLISLPEQLRKDVSARKEAINASDVTFLCLPDDAAREAVLLVENPDTVVIDASTAHRTAAGWAYGFPELSAAHRAAIAQGKRIANPGCYASGFISLRPTIPSFAMPSADTPAQGKRGSRSMRRKTARRSTIRPVCMRFRFRTNICPR